MEDFIGKFNGDQIDVKLEKVKDMVGATASAAGTAGLVPAPAKGDESKFLCGDGTYKDIPASYPDYTVFDIVAKLYEDTTNISQEDYQTLLSKFPLINNNEYYAYFDCKSPITNLRGVKDQDNIIYISTNINDSTLSN